MCAESAGCVGVVTRPARIDYTHSRGQRAARVTEAHLADESGESVRAASVFASRLESFLSVSSCSKRGGHGFVRCAVRRGSASCAMRWHAMLCRCDAVRSAVCA